MRTRRPMYSLASFSTEADKIAVQAEAIFDDVWTSLEDRRGKEGMALPKEIMWLGGAPGSGKGTNTNFIMRERGLTAPPVVISDLLKTPEMEAIKADGGMVGDMEVTSLLFEELLDPKYQSGVVVDGFPRTEVQADITRKLYDRMLSNYQHFKTTEHSDEFSRPIFRICVLYVDQTESVKRQLARGQNALEHNKRVRETGEGKLKPERVTDYNPDLAKKRYLTFKSSTFNALEELGQHFIYNIVQAMGDFAQVEANIKQEMDYQSGLELNPETHEKIHHLLRASEVTTHARQTLVASLDGYSANNADEFERTVSALETYVYPAIERHALMGKCEVPLSGTLFQNSKLATDIALCVLADRGFRAVVVTKSADTTSEGVRLCLEWDAPKLRLN